jgi:hypothetical protein
VLWLELAVASAVDDVEYRASWEEKLSEWTVPGVKSRAIESFRILVTPSIDNSTLLQFYPPPDCSLFP